MTPPLHVEYARDGEQFHRVGSDEGFADIDAASSFLRYQSKGTDWVGTVRIVDQDGVTIESVTRVALT